MIKFQKIYTRIPATIRNELYLLLTSHDPSQEAQEVLQAEGSQNFEEILSSLNSSEVWLAIGKHLMEKFEDYKIHKKLQELSKFHANNEQAKMRARGLKLEQSFQVKENVFCQGIGFFYVLEAMARKENCKVNVPESIVIGFMHMQTTKIWTDKQGILRCSLVEWEDLPKEIERIHSKSDSKLFPCSLLKYEMYGAEGLKVKSETFLFKSHETQDILWKIQLLNHNNSYMVFQEFIRPKTSTASKIRVSFSTKIERVFRINNPKIIKQRRENLSKIKKGKIIHLAWNESSISCENLDYYKHSAEICDFFFEISHFLQENPDFLKFSEFLEKKKNKSIKKLEILGNHDFQRRSSKLILTQQSRSKLLRTFTTSLSDSDSLVYPVNNFSSLEAIPQIFLEILRFSKILLPPNQKVAEIVADFLEDPKGLTFLHKLQKVVCVEKSVAQVPVVKAFRHISLYSATEGSSVTKGKRQQVCCGDYCNILKKNDLKTSEKIEVIIKARPEHSNGLFQLLKIQNFLNLDSAQSLFNQGNRIGTPLTQNMQYKTVRRMILEDRNDPNSLKSALASLPEDIIKELGLSKLKSSENEKFQMHHLNKKLSWEFELVPVCAMCYKIYGLKDSQMKTSSNVLKRGQNSSFKHWKAGETKFEIKKQTKVQKSYVDFGKILGNLNSQINYPKFIKEKILNSSHVRVKKGLDEVKEFVPNKPVIHHWASTTKISSNIINEVVEKFEKIQKTIKNSKTSGNLKKLNNSVI